MRTKNVVVEKWNPKWKDEFERIVVSLGEDVIYNSIKIEHGGSTSVEGLSAKPIIDLDIVIENDKFEIIKRLLKMAIEYAKSHGIEIINLEVRSDNFRAIHVYEKFGFRKIGTAPAYFKIGGSYIDFDIMYLDLRNN